MAAICNLGWCPDRADLRCFACPRDRGVQTVSIATLREHWLRTVECDHASDRDKPHCACSRVDLGWHPSVGAAVEAWLAHVAGVSPPPGNTAPASAKDDGSKQQGGL
jgi:hypothetical protein